MENSRVFYAYTPYPDEELKAFGVFERATVAARLVKSVEGFQTFEYGVSICSKEDNFNKKVGRDLALISLEAGYGKTPFAQHYQDIADNNFLDLERNGTERATIKFVNDLSNHIFLKLEKHKRKVGEFNKKYKM